MSADPLPIIAGDCQGGGNLEGVGDATVNADPLLLPGVTGNNTSSSRRSDDNGCNGGHVTADPIGADQVITVALWPPASAWLLVGAAAAAVTALWLCSSELSRRRQD